MLALALALLIGILALLIGILALLIGIRVEKIKNKVSFVEVISLVPSCRCNIHLLYKVTKTTLRITTTNTNTCLVNCLMVNVYC